MGKFAMTAEELKAKVGAENLSAELVSRIEQEVDDHSPGPDSPMSNALRAYLYNYCESTEDWGGEDIGFMAACFSDGWNYREKS